MTDKIKNDTEQSVDDIVNDILGNAPTTEVRQIRLPSLGRIYGLPSEYVTIRAMTFEDEKALMAAKSSNQAINMLISRCVEEPIEPRDLLAQDKIFIIVNIRAISVGNDYKLNITCGSCSHQNNVSIDVVNEFPCEYPEVPVERTVEVELPVIKKKVILRRASSTELEMSTTALLDKLWTFIISIDGNMDGRVRHEVMKRIPRQDAHVIIRNLGCEGIGLDTRFLFTCSECGHEEVKNLAFDEDFFTMK